jgi:hypothetical protein
MLILVVILLLVSSSSSTPIIVVFSTMIFSCFRNVQFLMMEEDDGLLEDFHFYLFVSRYALSDPSLRFLRF